MVVGPEGDSREVGPTRRGNSVERRERRVHVRIIGREQVEEVRARLKERNETIGIAESSTGGLISAALLSIGGASAYFRGGGVIYTAYARQAFLEIPNPLPAPIERASTEPYALLLADTVRARLGAHWGLGETGATGPTGNRPTATRPFRIPDCAVGAVQSEPLVQNS